MAAVGGAMDESYAERAKRANLQPNFKNNFKPQGSRIAHDAVDVPSGSTSDTLDSSPAHSSTHTPTSNLVLPPSIPVSSASSEQASPLRSVNPLPPRNAWSDRNAWRTPQKPPSTATSTPLVPNGSRNPTGIDSSAQDMSQETRSRVKSPVKAPARPNQQNDSDPFIVNYNLNTSSLADAEHWPQVGNATAPVSSPLRPKPSVSSLPSATSVSVPQTPVKGVVESENEATPSKKSKGEKTKWVPIPPKELQATADEITRQSQTGRSSSKSRSPHINGRGTRVHEDFGEGKQGGRSLSGGERSSPITTGNTRHDRNSSLTFPSSASSRRVSPLNLTTSLPTTTANTVLDPAPSSDLPSAPREPPPSQPHSRSITTQQNRQNPASFSFVEPFVPSNPPNRPSAHSRNPSQNPHPPSSPVVYAPMWSGVPVYMPYFQPQNPYPSIPHSANSLSPLVTQTGNEASPSRNLRQQRRRRPQPKDAVPLAGYRSNTAEVFKYEETERVLIQCDEEVAQTEENEPDGSTLHTAARTRDSWWSYGVGKDRISRWLRKHQELKESALTGQQLSEGPPINFIVQSDEPISTNSDSPVENAILQGGGNSTREAGHSVAPIYHQGWPAPGAGPSAIDIGLAMGMPMPPPALPPPPLLMGMPPAPPYLPSPGSATSRMEWASRDDSFSAMQSPHFPYPQYGYPPPLAPNGPMSNYTGDGQGRGNNRWRDERYATRGGRSRGFNGRGRGIRGANVSRLPYNSHVSSPGGSNQPSYPAQHVHNSATVYIPEPVMHPSMYPYPASLPPTSFTDYHQAPASSSDSPGDSQVRPPSPKPLTHLNFPLDATRYKLLGQIEYYFSRDNVAKDIYLRERMDSNGWVPIAVLQSFPRIQRLKVSDDLIRETLQWSHFVEVRQNHIRMAHEDWRNFVLPTASESTVPDAPPPTWYPPPPFHPGYMAPMYPHPPQIYPYYPQPQKTSPHLQGGVADHILRRPEDKIFNGNGVIESGTSAGDSFDSTPHTEGEEVETSEDDVVFLIGDPLPMQRSAPAASNS